MDGKSFTKSKKPFTTIKYMIPFDIKCLNCLKIIKKGKKIIAIKENTPKLNYMGIFFLRFYFKCIYCFNGISIKTNPKNYSYSLEINKN